jgi:hypothetical protein
VSGKNRQTAPCDHIKDADITGSQTDSNDILLVRKGFWGVVRGNHTRAYAPFVWAPLDNFHLSQGSRGIPLVKPRRGRAKREDITVKAGRGAADFIEVRQDQALGITCPSAGDPCLNMDE